MKNNKYICLHISCRLYFLKNEKVKTELLGNILFKNIETQSICLKYLSKICTKHSSKYDLELKLSELV